MLNSLRYILKSQNLPRLKRSNIKNYKFLFSSIENPGKEQNQVNQNKKSETKPNLYYPIKKINFNQRSEFPIFELDVEKATIPSRPITFFKSFLPFFAYSTAYIFYFDIYNYYHLIPLLYFFYRGGNLLVKNIQAEAVRVRAVFLKSDCETLIVALKRSVPFYNIGEEIELPDHEDHLKFQFKINDIVKVGFLQDLAETGADQNDNNENKDYIPINRKKENKEEDPEKVIEEAAKKEEEEAKKMEKIGIVINKGGIKIPLVIDIDFNKNKAYSDYLLAIAEHKQLVLRQQILI